MELNFYLICLGVGFVFTLGTAFFGHVLGGGHDGHVDGSGGHASAGADTSDMPGISPMSPLIIACFLSAFGGLGFIFQSMPATHEPWKSAPLAVLGAVAIAWCLLWILRQLFIRTDSSSEAHIGTLIGTIAQVITPIPENGVGEIAYVQKGARYSAPAREEKGVPIPNGIAVKIVRVAGSQFYVSASHT
jgi:membrane protein implicated in regulation of membrane protease activity